MTKNFQTTTILYYTFFLPGIVIYEFVYWLVAGLLDVRAERAIAWPEKQEIGELRLNFVRLSKKASPVKVSIINIAPLVAGTLIIWFISGSILNVGPALELMSSGTLENFREGLNDLTSTPDFWLWVYFLFTVANTMIPDPKVLRTWGWVIAGFIIISGALFMVGIGGTALDESFFEPVINGLNGLSGIFGVVVVLDIFAIVLLSIIENTIEWITGDSATFKGGKMIAMRREEVQALKRQERERQRAAHKAAKQPVVIPGITGTPTIYKLPLPIPGPPGQEAVTPQAPTILQPQRSQPAISVGGQPARRIEPAIISGVAAFKRDDVKPEEENLHDENEIAEEKRPPQASRLEKPTVKAVEDIDEEDESEELVYEDIDDRLDDDESDEDQDEDEDDSDEDNDLIYEDAEDPA